MAAWEGVGGRQRDGYSLHQRLSGGGGLRGATRDHQGWVHRGEGPSWDIKVGVRPALGHHISPKQLPHVPRDHWPPHVASLSTGQAMVTMSFIVTPRL